MSHRAVGFGLGVVVFGGSAAWLLNFLSHTKLSTEETRKEKAHNARLQHTKSRIVAGYDGLPSSYETTGEDSNSSMMPPRRSSSLRQYQTKVRGRQFLSISHAYRHQAFGVLVPDLSLLRSPQA